MKSSLLAAVAAAFALAAPLTLAQSPLAGTWKFNKEKSKLAGDTITFAPAGPGSVRVTTAGLSYTFKPDGSPTATPLGQVASWTKVDDSTWRDVVKLGPTLLSTDTYMLSGDGKNLSITYQGTKPNGESFNDSATYMRVIGSKGFMGKWKSTKVDADMAGYEFKDNGDGSILWSLPQYKATVNLKLDGKDYPASGPTVPPGLTLTLTKTGPRSFAMIEKKDGKPLFKATEVVSADGKTLTETGRPVLVSEPSTSVYEKQ